MTQCLSVCLSAGSALHGVNAQRLQPANSSPRHFHPAAFTPQPRKPDDEQLLWRCSGCNCDATVARLPCSGRATTVRRMEVARFRSAISKIRRREKNDPDANVWARLLSPTTNPNLNQNLLNPYSNFCDGEASEMARRYQSLGESLRSCNDRLRIRILRILKFTKIHEFLRILKLSILKFIKFKLSHSSLPSSKNSSLRRKGST